jgi:hypothetical protein
MLENNHIHSEAFLKALQQLPLIRKQLIVHAKEILQETNNESEEKSIDNVVQKILEEMKVNNLNAEGNDELLLEYGLKFLLRAQIPASRAAAKVRKKIKDNPTSSLP